MPDLPTLRSAARAAITVPGDAPVRWRYVTIEYGGAIAPVCSASSFTLDADLGGTSHPTHLLDDGTRDNTGLYDCCPGPHIEVWSDAMAEYLVALLNGDADRDARLRAAVLTEASGMLRLELFPAVYEDAGQRTAEGVRRAADELDRMAAVSAPGGER